MACYADDFAAVIDAVRPASPCTCSRTTGDRRDVGVPVPSGRSDHVASFTSVSGPSADHLVPLHLDALKRPYRPRGSAVR
jgi:hypothetical protein